MHNRIYYYKYVADDVNTINIHYRVTNALWMRVLTINTWWPIIRVYRVILLNYNGVQLRIGIMINSSVPHLFATNVFSYKLWMW